MEAFNKNTDGSIKSVNVNKLNQRDYELDLWNRRVKTIEQQFNVNLEFIENIEWSKQELMNYMDIQRNKGQLPQGIIIPNILVIPDEWSWTGLIENDNLVPVGDLQ